VTSILHEQSGRESVPLGAGDLAEAEEGRRYGLLLEGALPVMEGELRGLHRRFRVDSPASWLEQGLQALGGLP